MQPAPNTLTVTFRSGDRTVVFVATLGAGGEILADVTEPIVVTQAAPTGPAPAPAAATQPAASASTGSYYDDDDHEYEDDDHEYDDDSHEYEDDHHEYEGADDDD